MEHFVKQAVLFLDLDETNLEGILDTMLAKLLEEDEPSVSIHEAKLDIFTNDSGAFQPMARTPRDGVSPLVDQSPSSSLRSDETRTKTYFTYGGRMGINTRSRASMQIASIFMYARVPVIRL